MKFDLPEDQLREVVAAAVMAMISEEKREALAQQAVRDIMTEKPEKRGYGYGEPKTKFQEAFEYATERAARKVCAEYIDGEFKPVIEEMVREAMAKGRRRP